MSTLVKDQEIKEIYINGFEKVIEVIDKEADLHAFIAIHNTRLGPALGGTRFFPYRDREEALTDVLRLSSGMTYKFASVGLGLGGGKSVIIGNPRKKTKEQLLAFGRAVNSLNGQYICAEDSGVSCEDLEIVREETPFMVGLEREGSSGNPSPFTAFGTFKAIEATCQELFGSPSVYGKTIAIQGVGSVGAYLADFLFWHGANLIICDVNEENVRKVAQKTSAKVVDPVDIFKVQCDIFAPCAMGAAVNENTVPLLNCKAVCGSANNILKEKKDALALKKLGILYAPDFVVNAGGAINVALELTKEKYNPISARKKVEEIFDRIALIYKMAKNKGMTTVEAAYELAEYNVEKGIGKRTTPVIFHH